MCWFKQDEAIKTVQVSQTDTKDLTIQENETKVELTLWREMQNPSTLVTSSRFHTVLCQSGKKKENLEHNQKYDNQGIYEI